MQMLHRYLGMNILFAQAMVHLCSLHISSVTAAGKFGPGAGQHQAAGRGSVAAKMSAERQSAPANGCISSNR